MTTQTLTTLSSIVTWAAKISAASAEALTLKALFMSVFEDERARLRLEELRLKARRIGE